MTPSTRTGFAYVGAAYLLWGLLPLYIVMTAPTGAVELIAWRILLSVGFCAIVVTLARGWSRVGALLRDRSVVVTLGIAGLLVALNWLLYVYAVFSGQTVEGALGYFLNPLVSIVLALVVLRERMRPLQWAAVGIAAAAVAVLAIGYGRFPVLSIALALTFGTYGLVKKRVGTRVDAVGGFFVETLLIIPVAIACLVWAVVVDGGVTFGQVSFGHTAWVAVAGVVTSVPLLWFAAATKRLTLVEVGMMQFLAPILQFVIGVTVFHETMPSERWVGFVILWAALACFVVDLVRSGRRGRVDPDVLGEAT